MTHTELSTRHLPSETVDALTFEERWTRWQAKGARHDARVRRKVRLIAAVALLIGFAWAVVSLW